MKTKQYHLFFIIYISPQPHIPLLLPTAMAFQSNVISSQPQVSVTQYSSGLSDWSSNVCDCCEDCGICLCASFVPCILACKVAQDNGDSCCLPFLPGAMIALRTSMRSRYNIGGSVCDDWVVMACLPLCGLCQMAREQKMRG
ncbi:cornifelin homolog isoform X1 [Thunnus maccoyii]|uniref:cornifelin homolog isoform X1 n=2 Tax=Thunnus TaxID=8234 RepID=UPI001C4C1163|nr:cornifelin homolog isoform X1 [Thunnus maccoyii]